MYPVYAGSLHIPIIYGIRPDMPTLMATEASTAAMIVIEMKIKNCQEVITFLTKAVGTASAALVTAS